MAEPSLAGGPVATLTSSRTPRRRHALMARWLLQRIVFGLIVLLAVSAVIFIATVALPSSPARAILGRSATPQGIAALNRELGLNRPAVSQYFSWLGHLLTGHLGRSLATRGSVGSLISGRIVNSLTLLVLAALIALPLSAVLGTLSATRRGRTDRFLWLNAVALSAMPDFVIAIVLVLLFSVSVLHLLPAVALIPPGSSPLSHPTELVLPVCSLVLLNMPYLYRLIRASMIDALSSEYVRMARLKGMPPRIVIVRHALRNALLPAVQGAGLVLGWLLGGAVVIENVFQYPGLGSALTDAIQNRDLPVIQAIVLVFAVGIVTFNLIADCLTVYLTPKLRTGSFR